MENEVKKDIDILDLLAALHSGKGLIIGGTLFICVLAGALSFLIPKEYESTVQILPPKEQKQGFGFSDLLSALPIPTLRLGEKGTPADIFVATLKSRLTRRAMTRPKTVLFLSLCLIRTHRPQLIWRCTTRIFSIRRIRKLLKLRLRSACCLSARC